MVVGRTFDTASAAKYLHCHVETVRRAWRAGRLPGTKSQLRVGGPLTFTKDALDAYKAASTTQSKRAAG